MMEDSASPTAPIPPIAKSSPAAETRAMPSSPTFGGFELVEPLLANDDGELWLALNKANGATSGLALLAKDALEDPGAIWRFKQELARRGPTNDRAPMRLLTMNPPQIAEDATNLRRLHTVRPGSQIPVATSYAAPVRRERTEADKKKERKVIWVVLSILAACLLAFCGFYAALMYYFIVPTMKWQAEHEKAQQAVTNAKEYTAAVEQWASDNSVTPGTPYTWFDISDHVPMYLREGASKSAPKDPLGHDYVFPPSGADVQIHPATKNVLDDKEPDFFWQP
jgi:hypothetical protein